jgi:hypothetical protein
VQHLREKTGALLNEVSTGGGGYWWLPANKWKKEGFFFFMTDYMCLCFFSLSSPPLHCCYRTLHFRLACCCRTRSRATDSTFHRPRLSY